MLGSTRGEGGGHSPCKAYAFGVYELVGGGARTVLAKDHGRRGTLKAQLRGSTLAAFGIAEAGILT